MVYNFNSDTTVKWSVYRRFDEAERLLHELADQKMYAWDVETSGLDMWGEAKIIGHSFAWRRPNHQIRSIYLPCRHLTVGASLFEDMTQFDPDALSKVLKPILEGNALKIGHNLRFDVHMAHRDQIYTQAPVHDTQTAMRLIDENLKRYRLSSVLQEMRIVHQSDWKNMINADIKRAGRYLGLKPSDVKKKFGYAYVSIDTLGDYACQDAVYEFRLGESQLNYVQQWPNIWAMEMDLFWVCLEMERIGVPIDVAVLQELENEQQLIMNDLAPQIYQLAGEQFDITNDNELRRILFQKLGYPSQGQTKKEKKDRVDDDVLWTLGDQYQAQIAGLIRQFNDAQKIVSTYTQAIVDRADSYHILHSEIDPGGAKTGRVSSKSPNLQNIPIRTELGRRVRKAFVTRPGMFRYCLDYCLTGDTEIITSAGVVPIKDVLGKSVKVLSCSSDGELGFKPIERSARIGVKNVVELELDSGECVCCTEDHEWMTFDGRLIKTGDLQEGMKLRHVRLGKSERYPTWWWRSSFEYKYCHRLVAQDCLGVCPDGYEVDHIDNDPDNWVLSNLVYKTVSQNRGEAAGNWWADASEDQRQQKIKSLIHVIKTNRRSYRGEGNPNYGKRKGPVSLCKTCGCEFYRPPSHKAKYCSKECYAGGNNYKVVRVKKAGRRVVYHLTISDWHTFVLANGLVSGNSQLELRLLAHLTNDPILQRVYHQDLDAHSQTALEVFGTDKKVDGIDMRRIAKILNFGISFGMTEYGLMKNVNKSLPSGQEPITEEKARFYLSSFYQKYRGIDNYRQALWKQVSRNNGLFWNVFGRPRRVPAINSRSDYAVRAAQRQIISTMVQGSAADLVKYCMVAVHQYLKSQTDCEAYMVLMIHDDLQFDLVPEKSAKFIREIKRLMEHTCQKKISVPIKVDIDYFLDNWAQKKSMEL